MGINKSFNRNSKELQWETLRITMDKSYNAKQLALQLETVRVTLGNSEVKGKSNKRKQKELQCGKGRVTMDKMKLVRMGKSKSFSGKQSYNGKIRITI